MFFLLSSQVNHLEHSQSYCHNQVQIQIIWAITNVGGIGFIGFGVQSAKVQRSDV